MKKKIYYHDTDCGGVVYYANYLKYFEEARTEYFSDIGIDLTQYARDGVLFVVRHVDISYKSPARYADEITIETSVSKVKNVSIDFVQKIIRGQTVLVIAKTQLVCIDKTFHPQAIPVEIVKKAQDVCINC